MTFDLLARWGALIVALVAVAVLVGVRRRSGRLLAEADARLRDADARARHNEALEAQVRALTRDVGQAQSRVDEERAARVAAEEEAQRRQLLLDLGASVFGTLELTSLLPSLLKKLRERLAFHAAGIFLFTHDKTELALVAMEGLHESEMAGQLRADVNLPAIVASSDKPVLVTDAASDPRFERLVSSARVRSALYHPISSNKKVYGVICLWYHEIGSYTQRDVDLLASITAEAARAIRNAEVHQELNARLNFIVTLWEASKTLNSSSVESDQHTWRRRLEEVVRSAAFLFGAEKAVLLRYDGVSGKLAADVAVGVAESSLVRVASALNDSKAGLPFLLRAPFQVRNLVTDSRLGELAGFAEAEGTSSLLWAPLIGRQRTLGALALLTQGARSWTQMELQWLDIFANVLSVTLENTHLFQDLATEKSQLQVLVDNVPEGVFTTDAQGRVLTWNAAAHRITGWSLADVAGRRCAELIRCSTVEETWCETRCPLKIAMQTVARFDSGVHGVSLARADGTGVPVFITSGPIVSDDGTAMGAVLVFRDITKEKEIEQMKEDFLATITHDLKSPLASVMGYAELMLNPKLGPLNDNQQEFVQSILRSSKTLQFLIDNILEITRMEAGEMQFNPRAFNIGSVLAEIREMFVPLAAPKSLRLEVRCDDAIIVRGDRDKIKEVFINLYANAVKFTRPGGAITTTVEATDERVTIRVADTGKGIAADQIARLFERFAQVKSDERRGTGLGLYIVRRIIQAHEESVEVQSEVGVGTTFSFGLPRVRIQGGDALGVLVVDRDEETSATVQRILEEEGIATALANTARDALRAVSQRKPRVLLIDSQLPELTSENLLEELKSASSREGRELGILMLCNWREDVPVESERRVYRPPEATELLRKVRALIPTEPATGAQREAS